ncbi:hypothetical protein [Streptomyces sp. 1222.5]|uniref:hypothetical protein n=1 Tax=Streptomyces sp. 1222.5 TaxID=1881026 RepID=UPI003D759001
MRQTLGGLSAAQKVEAAEKGGEGTGRVHDRRSDPPLAGVVRSVDSGPEPGAPVLDRGGTRPEEEASMMDEQDDHFDVVVLGAGPGG